MTQTTISETLFETLCCERSVPCTRIATTTHKTPDYEVILGTQRVLVEVKQLDPNADDRRIHKALDEGTEIGGVASPAPRLRQQIASAYRQLKTAAREGQPCLVVIYNNSGILNFIDSFTVTTAMFGKYGVRLGLGSAGIVQETGRGFMGNASVTRNTCKSLSAVCVLKNARSGSLRLEAYHNPFALVPIDQKVLAFLAASQFRHPDPHNGIVVHWEPESVGA